MTALRHRRLEDLQRRGLAPRAQPCDLEAVKHLSPHDRRAPDQLDAAEITMTSTPGTFRAGFVALAAAMSAALAAAPAIAADFYAGKSIDMLIGAPPAGGYDIYARALARHFGQNIPGRPNIIAKNMPGAASGRAAGFLATPERRRERCADQRGGPRTWLPTTLRGRCRGPPRRRGARAGQRP